MHKYCIRAVGFSVLPSVKLSYIVFTRGVGWYLMFWYSNYLITPITNTLAIFLLVFWWYDTSLISDPLNLCFIICTVLCYQIRNISKVKWREVKWKWHTAKYGDPYSEFVLYIYPSKCTHTAVNTHTHTVNTHPEQWAAIYAAAPGDQLGVRYLAQGHLVVVLKVERMLYVYSSHRQSLPDRNSNSQPFDYESDSLPLGHDFPTVPIL